MVFFLVSSNNKYKSISKVDPPVSEKSNKTDVWVSGVHFQQHLVYPIVVRTSHWNALNTWTHLCWNNKDKTNEDSQVTTTRKSAGNLNSLPIHEEMRVGQRNKNITKRKTYSDSSAAF